MHIFSEIRDKFLKIRQTIHSLTETRQKFIWTGDCNNDFIKIKDALTSAPVLAYPEIGKHFILDTDASPKSIGAVLSQEIDSQECVIVYFSKCLSRPERNYLLCDQEGTASYCKRPGAILSLPLRRPNSWVDLETQKYDVEIRHRKGSAHGNADTLSRRPCPESCKYCSRIERKFGVVDPIVRQVTKPSISALDPWIDESVRRDQLADPEIKPIIKLKMMKSPLSSYNEALLGSLDSLDPLHLKNGVLYRKWESDDRKIFRWQLILQKTRVLTVFKEHHGRQLEVILVL
ncbi:retrovirus-related Pol polyprotein from transposon 412 [Trichonephila clavipes]|nr:retrovirus-related Pol polyprotein from transposon 412 [Trichonephila clavipes]